MTYFHPSMTFFVVRASRPPVGDSGQVSFQCSVVDLQEAPQFSSLSDTLPRDQLIAKLKTLRNLRVVGDEDSPTGWKITAGHSRGGRRCRADSMSAAVMLRFEGQERSQGDDRDLLEALEDQEIVVSRHQA